MSNIIEITDFLAPELDVYARLSEVQLLNREFPEKGMFIAESPKVIERALDAGYEPVSCLMEKRHIEGEGKQILARIKDVPIFCAEFDVLTQLTGFKLTRGMLCAMKRKPLLEVKEICKNKSRIVILDKVMNPTNVGAIIRSAAALGMDAVILTAGCSDPLYRRAVRVSMGTVFQIDWTFLNNDSFDEIKDLGFKTVAMALKDNSLSINDPLLMNENKLAIIMGTEGDGLSDKTISQSDYTVKIPMYHGVDSLNVAAASAVAFYELSNKQIYFPVFKCISHLFSVAEVHNLITTDKITIHFSNLCINLGNHLIEIFLWILLLTNTEHYYICFCHILHYITS